MEAKTRRAPSRKSREEQIKMVKHGTALAYVLVLLALTLVLLAGPTSARMTLLIVLIAALAAYAALLGWRVLRRRARR